MQREAVALPTLDRPERRNALDPRVLDEIDAVLDEVEHDDALRALVVTGAGETFSSGLHRASLSKNNSNVHRMGSTSGGQSRARLLDGIALLVVSQTDDRGCAGSLLGWRL